MSALDVIGSLRRRHMYDAIREATVTAARQSKLRIVHVSVQRTHVHLLVEAADKDLLARGMQGFQISAAKQINRAISRQRPGPRRHGGVFADRYHAEVITSSQRARQLLSYVLNNWRKHGEDRRSGTRDWKIDWYSSAPQFLDWTEYGHEVMSWRGPATYQALTVQPAMTWLLREGWKQHGATISSREVPTDKDRFPGKTST
jgi:REP element-mobilizing transposase RayT